MIVHAFLVGNLEAIFASVDIDLMVTLASVVTNLKTEILSGVRNQYHDKTVHTSFTTLHNSE